MKIIAVSASPRIGGNSDTLCDQFLKGAQEGGHETAKINLRKEKISPCLACYACRGTHTCIQKDDMQELLEKLIEAEVIVLSTPVYFYSMDAQMKICIDRCLPRYQEIKNKDFYYIITAADSQKTAADATIAGFRGFVRCLPGAQEKGIIYGLGAWKKGDILDQPAMQEAYEAGKKAGR
jgi:multimeric flavodoxin WrbA